MTLQTLLPIVTAVVDLLNTHSVVVFAFLMGVMFFMGVGARFRFMEEAETSNAWYKRITQDAQSQRVKDANGEVNLSALTWTHAAQSSRTVASEAAPLRRRLGSYGSAGSRSY
jgi:hypothetical protein